MSVLEPNQDYDDPVTKEINENLEQSMSRNVELRESKIAPNASSRV